MRSLWHYLRPRSPALSDEAALAAYVGEKCEASFATLVDRYSGLVMGVCRRMLGHAQDAEDAYQATFLVLAQRAHKLRKEGPLGPWLFGVARRVALKARTRRPGDRFAVELTGEMEPAGDEEAAPMDYAEVRPIIDDEVARLPQPYRHALILCHLEGRTKAEAARQLGCPEGTVSSRLMRAKEMLRARLLRRGVTLGSLVALESVLTPVPASALLMQNTIQAALCSGLGTALACGTISPSVLSLTQGVTQAMVLTKLKVLAAGIVLATGLTVGAGYVVGGWGQGKGDGAGNQVEGKSNLTVDRVIAASGVQEKKQADADPGAKPRHESDVRRLLNAPTDKFDKRFNEPATLSDHLDFTQKAFGITCIVDVEAFHQGNPSIKIEEINNSQMTVQRMPGATLDTVLRSMLYAVNRDNQPMPSTYMLRRGQIYIVPKTFVREAAEHLDVALDGKLEKLSIAEALEQLANDTGVSIILDPRQEETAKSTEVKTSFRNMKLISAVRLLANMADLSVMNVDGALYVTSPTNVAKLQAEMDGTPIVESGPAGTPGIGAPAQKPGVTGIGAVNAGEKAPGKRP